VTSSLQREIAAFKRVAWQEESRNKAKLVLLINRPDDKAIDFQVILYTCPTLNELSSRLLTYPLSGYVTVHDKGFSDLTGIKIIHSGRLR
jgi:hypothetical protein